MNRLFKTLEGKSVDFISYVTEFIKKNPDAKIHIGTDSQNIGWKTQYSLVVVLRYSHKGGHVLYQNIALKRISDMFTRLWKEAEFSIEAAQWIEENTALKVDVLELDFNDLKSEASNKLVASTKGWAESLGFKTCVKPESLIAIRAADHLCRGKNK